MPQQIAAPYRNQTLKLINSEDVLQGVLFYKRKEKKRGGGYYQFIICMMIEDFPQLSAC